MKPFKSMKAIWLAVGGAVVLVGFFAYALFAPSLAEPFGGEGEAPEVRVPKMQNAPNRFDPDTSK